MTQLYVHILGSAAGGGLPQWNCHCNNCVLARSDSSLVTARTQSSIAVSANQQDWVLINASPDILTQMQSFAQANKVSTKRGSGIQAVVITDSQIDHTTGLLMLREGCPLLLYCTATTEQELRTNHPILNTLNHWNGGMSVNNIELDSEFTLAQMVFCPVKLHSEAPPYSPHRHQPKEDHSIGLFVRHKDATTGLLYAPAIGEAIGDYLTGYINKAKCMLIDGTFWHDDEMVALGVGSSYGHQMGHLAIADTGGIIDQLAPFEKQRKILIHINNTNPIVREDSAERAQLVQNNIEVAFDGMAIAL